MMIICPNCDRKLNVSGQQLQMSEGQNSKSVSCKCGTQFKIRKDNEDENKEENSNE